MSISPNNPLISKRGQCIVMPMELFPAVDYFAVLAQYGTVIIDDTARYDKRHKQAHRYDIVDVTGRMSLTVPVTKPEHYTPRLTWNDIGISRHGNWWHVHRVTLESAYGRTPFFEFYIDRLARFCEPATPDRFISVAQLCREALIAVAAILGFENRIIFKSMLNQEEFDSYKPTTPTKKAEESAPQPYYQVRSSRHGFVSGLSILDLIFNMGPESSLYLLKSRDE